MGRERLKLSVVVPSHDRALRLRWLLNALEEQTLPRAQWELIVVHDSDYGELVAGHPVGPTELRVASCGPAHKRNAGWRAATADTVVFTDDDTRPPPDWLANALAAAERHPGAIVQGRTQPDPDEAVLLRAPHPRTVVVDPPTPHAPTCNIIYPRAVLARLDGFDAEGFPLLGGEDADLAHRAQRAGVPYVAAPEVLTFHMVDTMTLADRARFAWRWRQLPAMVRRNPGLRAHATLGIFWKPRHAWFPLAVAAAALAVRRRSPVPLALIVPWARAARPRYGSGVRARVREVAELPGQAVIDAVEITGLAAGSVKHRTLFL